MSLPIHNSDPVQVFESISGIPIESILWQNGQPEVMSLPIHNSAPV